MKMKITFLNFSSLQCQPDRFLRRPQQHWRVRRLGAEPPLGALRRALLLHQEPLPARRQGAHRDRLRPRRAGPDRGRDRRHGHHREVPGGALGADGDRHPPEVHAEEERPGKAKKLFGESFPLHFTKILKDNLQNHQSSGELVKRRVFFLRMTSHS